MATCPASFITPAPPAGLGWAVVTPSQRPLSWVRIPASPQGPVLWHRGLEQKLRGEATQPLLGEVSSDAVPLVGCGTQLFPGTATFPGPGQAGAAMGMLRRGCYLLLQGPGMFKAGDCSTLECPDLQSVPAVVLCLIN